MGEEGGVLKGRGEGLEVSCVSGQLPETLCVRSALVFLSHPRHAYFKEAARGERISHFQFSSENAQKRKRVAIARGIRTS